jgi:hypothetical protein
LSKRKYKQKFGSVAQVVEDLPSKYKPRGSMPATKKKKRLYSINTQIVFQILFGHQNYLEKYQSILQFQRLIGSSYFAGCK